MTEVQVNTIYQNHNINLWVEYTGTQNLGPPTSSFVICPLGDTVILKWQSVCVTRASNVFCTTNLLNVRLSM